MSAPTPKAVTYAVVNGTYMLPFYDAVELLRALQQATVVTPTYKNDTPFRLVEKPACLKLEVLTTAQHAAVHLEEPA